MWPNHARAARIKTVMARFRGNKILVLILACAMLAMRAAIPEGYMPAAPGSGLLFELCPSAVPSDVMEILQSRRGVRDHAHHGHHAQDAVADGAAQHSTHDAASCPIGHLLSPAVAVDTGWEPSPLPQAPEFSMAPVVVHIRSIRSAASSRGPPA